MNIGIDMCFTLTTSLFRGVGRYNKNLLEHLLRLDNEHSYFFFYPDFDADLDSLKVKIQSFLYENAIDLYYVLSPFDYCWEYSKHISPMLNKEWYGKTKLAATLYDLTPLILSKNIPEIYWQIMNFVKSCDIVFSISESTKADAVRLMGFEPDKIHVIMAGLDERFKPLENFDRLSITTKYGIRKPFMLYVGGSEYHKNILRLFASFAEANRSLGYSYQLVFCSKLSESVRQTIMEWSNATNITEHLVLTGHVPDEDLVQLYNGTSLFVLPSLYEGFGFPVLEAMACGVPVITSNNSSLSEIAGDAAYYVNPENTAEITSAMVHLLKNPDFCQHLVDIGLKRASLFAWNDVAGKVLRIINTVARKTIALFSPLAPIHSDIANLTTKILPELCKHYDCDIYIDDGYTPDIPVSDSHLHVYQHSSFRARASVYDAVFYHLSNSRDHLYMIPYLIETNGIIIMHETNLHKLTTAWTLEQNNLEQYFKVLKEEAGDQAPHLLDAILEGRIPDHQNHVIINKFYLEQSNAVIVDNCKSRNMLHNTGVSNIILAPHPVELPCLLEKQITDNFVFATFGNNLSHMQIDLVLTVLKKLYDNGFRKLEYHIIGESSPENINDLKILAEDLGIAQIVKFTGYLARTQYNQKMAEVHAAIQLDYPTNGETSAALLDTLSFGIPTIVCNLDSFVEIPDNSVYIIQTSPHIEAELMAAMTTLYTDLSLCESLSTNGRQYIASTHTIAGYVHQLHKAINLTNNRIKKVRLWKPSTVEKDASRSIDETNNNTLQTVRLKPDRLQRVRKRGKIVTYFSFDLAALPPRTIIQKAIMRISRKNKKNTLRIHRIKQSWSRKSAQRKIPVIQRKAVFSLKHGKRGRIAWDCTKWAQQWATKKRKNHGIYVSENMKSKLYVYLIKQG